jgi:outer membrane protein
MKQIKTLLISALLIVAANQTTNAQAKKAAVNQTTKTEVDTNQPSKIAHVNYNEIVTNMPEYIAAEKQFEKIYTTYQNDAKQMQDEFQAKLKKYEEEASIPGKVSDAVNVVRQKEVSDMQKRIQEFGQNAQKELQQKQEDITKPIIEKVKASIEKVGKAKGFQYILNSNSNSNPDAILLADGPNLTADVKKDLGF